MTISGYLSLHCVLSQVAICPRSGPEDWQTQWMQSSSVHSLPGTHLPGSSICSTKNQKSSIKKSMCRGFGRLPQVLLRLQYKEKPMQNRGSGLGYSKWFSSSALHGVILDWVEQQSIVKEITSGSQNFQETGQFCQPIFQG